MSRILEVENLTVELEGEKILENLSFHVDEGEILTILGPNGAGKTVLLRTLLGLLPYRGKISWKKDVKIGYVPQRLPFIRDFPLTVEEFFHLKEVSQQEIRKVLSSLQITDPNFLHKKMGVLSSGQFQRVLVAYALLGSPDVLLFDEPTAGIDVGAEETIYTLLNRLKKERDITILLVTHDLTVVYQFASHCLCLSNRGMLCFGTPRVINGAFLSKLYGGEVKVYEHRH
jgi:zinc transport system ATP-binding protein